MVRTVNLSDDAYATLQSLKREGESFSDVVNRLGGRQRIRELYGVLRPSEAKALRRAVDASRKRFDADLARRRARL